MGTGQSDAVQRANRNRVRVAASADLHYDRAARVSHQRLFEAASESADVLLLCGDLTDYGLAQEAEMLAQDLRVHARIPVVAVLGNHDFESGHVGQIRSIVERVGVTVLDGECTEVAGIGFAGVPGFGGGFGPRMLNAWGEPLIKAFVQEAIDHSLRLELALSRLRTHTRVVLLHYAPVRATLEGENLEILPFLGSSRLEGPLDRFKVAAAFHGHAHNGAPKGETTGKVPVYNVAVPLLERLHPGQPAFRVVEFDVGTAKGTAD